MKNKTFFDKGFTLLEVSIATFILTIGIGGSFVLIQRVFISSADFPSKLIATYLAQEGIEIVRNIRDTNWVKGASWDEGFEESGEYVYEIDYDNTDLPFPLACSPCNFSDLNFFYIDNGFYQYSYSEEETKFKRKVTINRSLEEPHILKVSVEVFWEEKGESRGPVRAQENLYKWR